MPEVFTTEFNVLFDDIRSWNEEMQRMPAICMRMNTILYSLRVARLLAVVSYADEEVTMEPYDIGGIFYRLCSLMEKVEHHLQSVLLQVLEARED